MRRERGQALVWVALMLPLFLAAVGLALDGGMVFNARRSLQNVADGAARAGAMQVDETTLRANGQIVLDPAAARQAAASYLTEQAGGMVGSVAANAQEVTVQVRRPVPTGFIRLVGIENVVMDATATARPCPGITQGAC